MSEYKPFKPSNFKLDKPPVSRNLFLHARNTSNVGDLKSTPYEYFTIPGESSVADFWSSVNAGEDRFDNIIVGGGVFSKNYVRTPMYFTRINPRRNLVLWGVGVDIPDTPLMPKEFTDRCALIGSRDFGGASIDGKKVVFCPCASAMNRAFDLARPKPAHKVVCYLHHNKKFSRPDLFKDFPRLNNYADFISALDFLSSGEVVVTNSYHGLYWATLLGKKVICLESGGKFAFFKWAPVFATAGSFRDVLEHADEIPAYPDAMAESRQLNMAFYQKVLEILA